MKKTKHIRSRKGRAMQYTYHQQTLFSSGESETGSPDSSGECQVIAVGRRRDGGTRYWCLRHKADATAKYGRPAKTCRASHIPPISSKDILELDIDKYKGGIALFAPCES